MKKRILDSLGADNPPAELTQPGQAMWWLKKGGLSMGPGWERAHEISQSGEGDIAFDRVHALIHWIEGDMGNAAYWYRRTGEERAESIDAEWERVVGLMD